MQDQNQKNTKTIRLVIAEDHHIVREALRQRLEVAEGIKVVGEARDGRELFEVVAESRPDLVLMDAKMPYHEPAESVRRLHELYPGLKVIVLSMYKSPYFVVEIFRAGVDGYVLKDDPAEGLLPAIRRTMAGKRWVSPQVALVVAYFVPREGLGRTEGLTEWDLQLLLEMAQGQRDEQIAERLRIPENSVRADIDGIFRKLEEPCPVGS